MIIITIILFIVLVCLMYYGYCTVMDIDPLWFLSSDKEKKKATTTMSSTPPVKDTSTETSGKTCKFEGEDLFNKKIYKWSDGTHIVKNPTNLPCSECNQYIFKDKNECVPYIFDSSENVQKDKSFCELHPSKDCVEPKDQHLRIFCDINDPKNTKNIPEYVNCIPTTGMCIIDTKAPKQICPF